MHTFLEDRGYKFYDVDKYKTHSDMAVVYWAKSKLIDRKKFQVVVRQYSMAYGLMKVSYEVSATFASDIRIRDKDDPTFEPEAWLDLKFYSLSDAFVRERLTEMENKLEKFFTISAGRKEEYD